MVKLITYDKREKESDNQCYNTIFTPSHKASIEIKEDSIEIKRVTFQTPSRNIKHLPQFLSNYNKLFSILHTRSNNHISRIISDLKEQFSDYYKSIYLDKYEGSHIFLIILKENSKKIRNDFYDYLDDIEEELGIKLYFKFIHPPLEKSLTAKKIL